MREKQEYLLPGLVLPTLPLLVKLGPADPVVDRSQADNLSREVHLVPLVLPASPAVVTAPDADDGEEAGEEEGGPGPEDDVEPGAGEVV